MTWIVCAERLPELRDDEILDRVSDDVLVWGYIGVLGSPSEQIALGSRPEWAALEQKDYAVMRLQQSDGEPLRWRGHDRGASVDAITHWMPLPEPPRE